MKVVGNFILKWIVLLGFVVDRAFTNVKRKIKQ